jgi:hypothetical protein
MGEVHRARDGSLGREIRLVAAAVYFVRLQVAGSVASSSVVIGRYTRFSLLSAGDTLLRSPSPCRVEELSVSPRVSNGR